jgi:hypothetical protein
MTVLQGLQMPGGLISQEQILAGVLEATVRDP